MIGWGIRWDTLQHSRHASDVGEASFRDTLLRGRLLATRGDVVLVFSVQWNLMRFSWKHQIDDFCCRMFSMALVSSYDVEEKRNRVQCGCPRGRGDSSQSIHCCPAVDRRDKIFHDFASLARWVLMNCRTE